ncbi:MAG: flagellar biosynthetic protein FliR [Steroidobacter sp.]
MNVDALMPWSLSVALLTVRLSVALVLSPPLSSYGIPVVVRVALTFVLAALTFAARSPAQSAAEWAATPLALFMPVMAEVFIGALLGLAAHIVLAALALAGRLLDVQIGFAIGSVFDPVTRASSNVLGALLTLLGVTLFFVSDAHVQLAMLVARSLDVLPLGQLPAFDDPLRPLLAAGSMFTLGLALAAPVALALLFTDLAIGVASRNMPQINVLILAMPIKIGVGYLVLALAVVGWGPVLEQAFAQVLELAGIL